MEQDPAVQKYSPSPTGVEGWGAGSSLGGLALPFLISGQQKKKTKPKPVSTMEEGTVWEKASWGLLRELMRG